MNMLQYQTRDGLTFIDPLHHVTFGEPPEIQGIAFNPNGSSAILHLHGPSIDAWDVLVHYSGHIVGIAGCLAALLALVVMWRRCRHPQQVGRRYCRKCNYDVSEQMALGSSPLPASEDQRCPECGSPCNQRRTRSGRSLMRRLVVPVCLLLLLAGGLSIFFAMRPRWHVTTDDWFSWPSASLTELSQKPKWAWLKQFERQGDVLMQFNLNTGVQTRMLYASEFMTFGPLTASPDFSVVYLGGRNGPLQVSTRDGGVVAEADYLFIRSDIGAPLVVDQEPERGAVFCFGMLGGENALMRWDTASGRATRIFGHTAYQYSPGRPVERTLHRLGPGGPAAWLSAPTFMEAYNRKQSILYLLDEVGSEVRSIDLGESIDYGAYPAVGADGKRAFFPQRFGDGVRGVDLTTGESLGVLRIPDWFTAHAWCVILSPGGQYLFIATDSVWIRDTSEGRWVARLKIPSNLYGTKLCISPDGRWLAAMAQRRPNAAETARAVRFAHDLVIWDLSSLPIDSGP